MWQSLLGYFERLGANFSFEKRAVLYSGHNNEKQKYSIGEINLKIQNTIKDLGVIMHISLRHTQHTVDLLLRAI